MSAGALIFASNPHNAGGGITKAAVPHMRPVVANRGGELGVRGWSQRRPVQPGLG